MNRIQVILTINTDQLPDNFGEILKKEQEAVAIWKQAGFLEHLFLREEKNGAVLIFQGLELVKVEELISSLPFYPLRKSIEYFSLIKQF